jgi:ubiquinone/menaquinone biosynthesis C-methylase UbiE
MRQEKGYTPPAGLHTLTPLYDLLTSLTGFGKRYKRRVLHSVNLTGRETLLDFGCGTGVLLEVAKTDSPHIKAIGIDPDQRALQIARGRLDRAGLEAELHQAFGQSLPLPDASVDLCFSTLAFHHINNEVKQKAFSEIYRVLKEDGQLILSDFYASKLRSRLRPKSTLLSGEMLAGYLEQAGFRNVQVLWRKFPFVRTIVGEKPPAKK